MLLCADADAAAADLASGALACPSCGTGRLRAWGYGRERIIRALGGERRRLRPRRGRCRSCGATRILLPAWSAPRLSLSTAATAGLGAARGTPSSGSPSARRAHRGRSG